MSASTDATPGRFSRKGGKAIAATRAGGGPCILWCDLDRLSNHTNADDHRVYRSVAEIEALDARDPLDVLSKRLVQEGRLLPEDWSAMRVEIAHEVREAYVRVEREAAPCPGEVERQLFAPANATPPVRTGARAETTMLQAVNGTLREALQSDPRILVFGEDVEDPKGGVFGITKGLSHAFPGRVVNSPLAEATIVGTAVGLAATGYRPVFELQFVDFAGPALNQIAAQVANLRWRTKGDWTCPLVLYAPYGAYLPGGGMWHSQSNEGLFANIPGLRIAVPSTPSDAAGLLWAAMHDDDPSLVLLPKHLLRAEAAPSTGEALAWGRGRTVRAGDDVTLVAWGNGVEIAEGAADLLAAGGTDAEVLDLRTLVPCDWDLVIDSVARTGRLVVVQEDARTCGFGQAVVAEVSERAFASLRAAPILVSRPDVPVPYAPALELAVLPSVEDVVRAVRDTQLRSADLTMRSEEARSAEGPTVLTVPQLGEGLRRVRVTAHLKRVGERVAMDEPLYEVETDKANVAVESPVEGVLVEWCVPAGAEVEVHGPIARIAAEGATVSGAIERGDYEETPLSDRQRAMNRSAVGGRLDVPIPASVGRPIAWNLVEAARARLRILHPRLRLTEFGVFAFATARAAAAHPKFRSSLVARGETVRRYDHVDLGFAIALPGDELATAVVRRADALTAEEFGTAMRERHREAKTGASQSDARTTLLLSSLAGHDVTDAAPVLFPPAIATLFLGAPHEGATRREANLRLAFDHRLINGVGAAEFLQGIEEALTALGTA